MNSGRPHDWPVPHGSILVAGVAAGARRSSGISAKRSCCRPRPHFFTSILADRHPWPKCRMGRRRRQEAHRCHKMAARAPSAGANARCFMQHLLQNCRADGAKTPAIFNLTPPVPNQAFIRPFYGSSAGGPHALTDASPSGRLMRARTFQDRGDAHTPAVQTEISPRWPP